MKELSKLHFAVSLLSQNVKLYIYEQVGAVMLHNQNAAKQHHWGMDVSQTLHCSNQSS